MEKITIETPTFLFKAQHFFASLLAPLTMACQLFFRLVDLELVFGLVLGLAIGEAVTLYFRVVVDLSGYILLKVLINFLRC